MKGLNVTLNDRVKSHIAHPLVVKEVMSSNLGSTQHYIVSKDVKHGFYCCYLRCATLIDRVEGMLKTGATHCYAQIGLPDKDHAIKELIVC